MSARTASRAYNAEKEDLEEREMLFAEAIILPKNAISLHLVTLGFYFRVSVYKDEMITSLQTVCICVTRKTCNSHFTLF